jgi:hypothetical protein
MTTRSYELRLEGIDSPPGQIPLRDLADLGGALQQTVTRIARQVAGAEGPGRHPSLIDRVSELRLTGLGEGSTVLELSLGDEAALPMPGADEDEIARRFEESLMAIATNIPPSWVSPQVKESIGRIVSRLESAGATSLTASWATDGSAVEQVIVVNQIKPAVWVVDQEHETEQVSMTGRLDKVDLRARRFRIRDDVGHDITLEDVSDLDTAAQLIGQRVVASGAAERNGERVVRITGPVLALERLPEEWFATLPGELSAGGPVPTGGIPGVTKADVDEFLTEIRA